MTGKLVIVVAAAVTFGAALGVVITGAVFCAGTLHVARKVGPASAGAATVTIIAAD